MMPPGSNRDFRHQLGGGWLQGLLCRHYKEQGVTPVGNALKTIFSLAGRLIT